METSANVPERKVYNENILEMFTEADWAWWNERLTEEDRLDLSKLVVGQWLRLMEEAHIYRISTVTYWDFLQITDDEDIKAIKATAFIWSLNNSIPLSEKEVEHALYRAALIYHSLFPKNDKEWNWDWEILFPDVFAPMLNREDWEISAEDSVRYGEWLVTLRFLFIAIVKRICTSFMELSPSRLKIVCERLMTFTYTESPDLLAELNLSNPAYLHPVLMTLCIFHAGTTNGGKFTNQNCWRAIYRVLHDRGFECAMSPETFIAYMHREINDRLHKFFIAWDAEDHWKSPYAVKWEVDKKSGKVKVDSSPLKGQTRDQYPFYQETPWREWEEARQEIKKSSPGEFKKICGTEDTLDSMLAVAETFNNVLSIYCGTPADELFPVTTD